MLNMGFMKLRVSACPVLYGEPGGFLESCWSSVCVGSPKKPMVLSPAEGCSIAGLASRVGKAVKSNFPSSCPLTGFHEKVVHTFRVGIPASKESFTGVLSGKCVN